MTTGKARAQDERLAELERRNGLRRDTDKELFEMSQKAFDLAQKADYAISTHERVCAERFGNIQKYMSMTLGLMKWAGAGLISLLLGIIALLLRQQGII